MYADLLGVDDGAIACCTHGSGALDDTFYAFPTVLRLHNERYLR